MDALPFGDQRVRHRLGRGVSVELVAIYIYIYNSYIFFGNKAQLEERRHRKSLESAKAALVRCHWEVEW